MTTETSTTTTTTSGAALSPELTQEARHLLTQARTAAREAITGELSAVFPLLATAMETGEEPEGVPEWMRSAFAEAAMPDATMDWAIGRARLSARAANLMAFAVARGLSPELAAALDRMGLLHAHDEDTGSGPAASLYALAKFAGVGLYEFASETWAGVGMPLPAATEEALVCA
ncbi:MAG: hypothetical protein OEL88_15120 [Sterolibacteriaceae bacterium MAG5]|nr:hypothetical protein [Candidatus Nitricoxidireducens bremensis]